MELNMNLLHLRYFAELAQTLHYTRAAERLCIAQPSLSHAISQMEAELGVPLFEKVGKSIVLTHYGEQFLACAQQTLMTLDNGVDALQRVGRGEGLIRLDVKIMQISNPAWERNFYLISNDRSYLSPAAREFRQFILEGVTL